MTMKKTYMAPAAQAITFDAMTMLAASDPTEADVKVVNTVVDASNSYSGEKGWGNDTWASED